MSRTLLTGEKKVRGTMASLLLSERAPPDWGPESWTCYCGGQEGHFCRECLRGDSPGDCPTPNQDPALCKGNHWRSKCPCNQMEGEVPSPMDWWVQASHPQSTSWHQCWGATMAEKQTVIFLLDSGACFSFSFFSWSPVKWQKLLFRANLASP
jgi:hypothetical protein